MGFFAKSYKGALLIELLLGLFLVLVALLSVFGLFVLSDKVALRADRLEQARLLAGRLMEQEMAQNFDTVVSEAAKQAVQPAQAIATEEFSHTKRRGVEVETNFRQKIEVVQKSPRLYRIVVTVDWLEGSGGSAQRQAVVLEGLKSEQW